MTSQYTKYDWSQNLNSCLENENDHAHMSGLLKVTRSNNFPNVHMDS